MNKKIAVLTAAAAVVAMVWGPVAMGHGNKPGSSSVMIGGGEVKVDFVGPESKGRDVLALLPPGGYWRMGADKATTLTTEVDLKVGDATVPKGTYTLVAHFSEDKSWSLIIADGVSSGSKPTKLVAQASGSIEKLDTEAANMTISLKENGGKGMFILDWGMARLTAEFAAA